MLISLAFAEPGNKNGNPGRPPAPGGKRPGGSNGGMNPPPKPSAPPKPSSSNPPPPPPSKDSRPDRRFSTNSHDGTYNFRGNRTSEKKEKLAVLESYYLIEENGSVNVTLRFNQSINPLSLSSKNFLLNGESLNEEMNFTYNKKIDSVSFTIDAKEIETLELVNLESYDGKKITAAKISLHKRR